MKAWQLRIAAASMINLATENELFLNEKANTLNYPLTENKNQLKPA